MKEGRCPVSVCQFNFLSLSKISTHLSFHLLGEGIIPAC